MGVTSRADWDFVQSYLRELDRARARGEEFVLSPEAADRLKAVLGPDVVGVVPGVGGPTRPVPPPAPEEQPWRRDEIFTTPIEPEPARVDAELLYQECAKALAVIAGVAPVTPLRAGRIVAATVRAHLDRLGIRAHVVVGLDENGRGQIRASTRGYLALLLAGVPCGVLPGADP